MNSSFYRTMFEEELNKIWEQQFRRRFSERALEAEMKLLDGSTTRIVYLDNAATTKPFQAVKKVVDKSLDEYGSVHRGSGHQSKRTTQMYESARGTIRKFVGASSENYVIFTNNTTGAINQLANLWERHFGRDSRFYFSDEEHSSNALPWAFSPACPTVWNKCPRDEQGSIGISKLPEMLKIGDARRNWKKLLAVTGSSNVTGYQPKIHELARVVHDHNGKIFVDVCQLIPHRKVDMCSDDDPDHIDFLAFSGHKMYAPLGVGVLVGPKQFFDNVQPYQMGGGNIIYIAEPMNVVRGNTVRDHDPGTPNVIGVLALEAAIQELQDIGMKNVHEYESSLVRLAFDGLQQIRGVTLYIPEHYGTVIPFDIQDIPHKLVAEILDQEYGIATRAGSFCTYALMRRLKPFENPLGWNKTLREAQEGITTKIPGIVRASFSIFNRPEDAKKLVDAVGDISKKGFSYYKERYEMNQRDGSWKPISSHI